VKRNMGIASFCGWEIVPLNVPCNLAINEPGGGQEYRPKRQDDQQRAEAETHAKAEIERTISPHSR
jgi:hypothetical protein